MPLVVIGIVGDLIFMDILALAPHSSQLDELAGVDLVGSASAILEFCRNPSAVDNNRRTVNSNRVLFSESSAERKTTALIAVERIDHIIPLQLVAGLIYVGCGDQHFFGGVELAENEIGLETMIDIELLLWHPPPGEVELLPGGDILSTGVETIVALRAQEVLLDELTIVEVGEGSSQETEENTSLLHEVAILITHTLNQASCQHFYN